MNSAAPVDAFDEWLGKLPSGWSLKKVGREFKVVGSGTTPPTENPAWYGDGYPWVTTGELRETLITETEKSVTEEAIRAFTTLRRYQPGTLLVAMYGATIGRTGILGCEATTNQACCAMSEPIGLEPRYVYYWLQAFREQLIRKASGGGQPNVNQDTIRELRISSPDRQLQQSIANFLDAQTARIDALIAGKAHLVEKLDELWTARLAHELGGADNASRPTHYEWYPKIPENWRVVPFKHAVRFIEGPGIMASDFLDEGVPLLRVSSVRGAVATLDGCNYLDPEKVSRTWAHFRVKCGDLLISASASMGTVSLVTEETEGAVPYTGIIILRPVDGVATRDFIRSFVVSDQFLRQIDIMKAGATIQHFGPTHLKQVIMALPSSLKEQAAIARQLEDSRVQHSALKIQVAEHIDRLREYRSSLISAAVTGQLDVGTLKEAR